MTDSRCIAVNSVSVGIATEHAPGERRIALVPSMIRRLAERGTPVIVASGAGSGADITDEALADAGASIGDPAKADVLVCVNPPPREEIAQLREGTVLVGMLDPWSGTERIEQMERAGVTAFALESVPRISRAQGMDALSSQANVAGYRAALLAAWQLPRFFPSLTTAAGSVKPANVLVLGAGVAGLQALATAKRLGGRTSGYDVRPEVADQVRSVGAQWLELNIDAAGAGGYARELTEDEKVEQARGLTEAIGGFDVVITTALVPGRRAPVLVTAEAVRGMPAGGVIVDLAGDTGGNCELTQPGEVITREGITICSPLTLAADMPGHASELYARNIVEYLELIIDTDAQLRLDGRDEIIAGSCVAGHDRLTRPEPGTGEHSKNDRATEQQEVG